jgi:hypothetical protein
MCPTQSLILHKVLQKKGKPCHFVKTKATQEFKKKRAKTKSAHKSGKEGASELEEGESAI